MEHAEISDSDLMAGVSGGGVVDGGVDVVVDVESGVIVEDCDLCL